MIPQIPLLKNIDSNNFFLMAGPCVVENEEMIFQTATRLKEICERLKIPLIFKSSYRKANRSSASSFTGIGDEAALKILVKVREQLQLPIVTDIHEAHEAAIAAEVLALGFTFVADTSDATSQAREIDLWLELKKA